MLPEKRVSNVEAGSVLGAQTSQDPNHPQESYVGDSLHKTLASMLDALKVTVYPEDKVVAFPDPSLGLGSVIRITRATTVTVNDGDDKSVYRTWQGTLAGLFEEKNIEIGDKDQVVPGVDKAVTMNLSVKITRVSETELKETVSIPFQTVNKDDPNLEKGQQKVETAGANGTKERIYRLRRENGKLVSKVLISEKIVKAAVNKVVLNGTRPPLVKKGIYKDEVNAAALKYGLSPAALYCLMIQESNGHATSGYPNGAHQGLFQYDSGYWKGASANAGYSGAAITDPVAQIYTTARELARGQGGRWSPWGSCKNK